jgi:hypothetical protein
MSTAAKGALKVIDESTAVLQGQLERAVTGDAEARMLLELTRDLPSATPAPSCTAATPG